MTRNVRALRLRLSKMKRRCLQSHVIAEQRRRRDFAFTQINMCGATSLSEALGQAIELHDTAQERHPYESVIFYYAFHHKTMYGATEVGNLPLNCWLRAALERDDELSRITAREMRPYRDWSTI